MPNNIKLSNLLLFLDSFAFLFPVRKVTSGKKQILLVKLDAIGDFILWLDAARAFKMLFPPDEYEITLLGNGLWCSLAGQLPYFNKVWALDRKKFFSNLIYRIKLFAKVRRTGFAAVVYCSYSRELFYGDAIVRVSGANEKVGFESDLTNTMPWRNRISDRWYTRLIVTPPYLLMELRRNAEFMRGLGLLDFKASLPLLPITSKFPEGFKPQKYFVLFPGAGKADRKWPLLRFKEIAERIFRHTGWTAVVCGGPGEEALGELLRQEAHIPLENWTGKTTLEELIVVIAKAQLLVGNETSAVHIAAAVSTPAVCILGGGHFGRFMPYELEATTNKPLPDIVYHLLECFNCNWECVHVITQGKAVPCIEHISVDKVWETVLTALDKILVKKNIPGA